MIDFNVSWDVNNDNKSHNRLSQVHFLVWLSKVFVRAAFGSSQRTPSALSAPHLDNKFSASTALLAWFQLHISTPKKEKLQGAESDGGVSAYENLR